MWVFFGSQAVEIECQRGTTDLLKRTRGETGAGCSRPLTNVREFRPLLAHPAHQRRCLLRHGVHALIGQARDQRVRHVAAEEMGGNAIRHPQRAGQYRTLGFLDEHQALIHQRRAGREPASGVGAARRQSAQLDAETNARPTAGDVVLQVAVQPLEAQVDIGRHRDQQQLDVDLLEPEGPRQAAQPKISAVALSGIGGRFDLLTGFGRPGIGRQWPSLLREQSIDVRLGDIQPAKAIIRFRIRRPAPCHRRSNPRLDQLEPPQNMNHRRVGDRCQAWRRHRPTSG